MAADAIGIGAGGFSGQYSSTAGGVGGSSASDLQSTIDRLTKEREKFEKLNNETNSRAADRKINELDKRISNLRKRLDKLKGDDGECKTCENRKYQDESDDPGVSYQTATKISSGAAEAAVRGHEYEHVTRDQAKADREGREVIYQNVIIKHAICPECGKTYVAGGMTTTVTRNKPADASSDLGRRFRVGMNDGQKKAGLLNVLA